MYTNKEFTQLSEYVESLLKNGKKSDHEDFKILFNIFGQEKITKIAKEILQKEKNARTNEMPLL